MSMNIRVLISAAVLIGSACFAGPRAYITSCCFGGATVSVISNATNTESGVLPNISAAAIAFSPDSETAYIASGGAIQIVDVGTRKITASFADNYGPSAIAISPDGVTAYVAESGTGNGTVTAFGLPQGNVIAHLTIAPSYQCTDIKVSPDGTKVYAACQQYPLEGPGVNYFTVIDATSKTVTQTIQTKGNGNYSSLSVSADGNRAYMTVSGSHLDAYAVIDLSTVRVLARPA
jgi:DNA-binding beta-propeller fold protein YncE